jgi:hypothetical protein
MTSDMTVLGLLLLVLCASLDLSLALLKNHRFLQLSPRTIRASTAAFASLSAAGAAEIKKKDGVFEATKIMQKYDIDCENDATLSSRSSPLLPLPLLSLHPRIRFCLPLDLLLLHPLLPSTVPLLLSAVSLSLSDFRCFCLLLHRFLCTSAASASASAASFSTTPTYVIISLSRSLSVLDLRRQKEGRKNGMSPAMVEFQRAQELQVVGVQAEWDVLRNATSVLTANADGIVLGILTPTGTKGQYWRVA